MTDKAKIGILGFSDGEPEVHEQLKDFVQAQLKTISAALKNTGQVEVIEGDKLINSVSSAKEEALKLLS
ncbi:unnamed protein product, partial [marine sediment metagenome]